MKDFAGKIAVITGGGTGMGRELARQLVAEGCNVAMCDVSVDAMAETKRLCEVQKLPQGLRVTTHIADVSIEDQLLRFRDEIAEQQSTDKVHLLFNNAGIGGGGSLFTNSREQWERTFNISWGGVYFGVRTFPFAVFLLQFFFAVFLRGESIPLPRRAFPSARPIAPVPP